MSSLKKLSIKEIYRLYNTLRGGTIKPQSFLVDEVLLILEQIGVEEFKSAMKIMYGKGEIKDPAESAVLFSKGLINTKFFEFSNFVEMMRANKSR